VSRLSNRLSRNHKLRQQLPSGPQRLLVIPKPEPKHGQGTQQHHRDTRRPGALFRADDDDDSNASKFCPSLHNKGAIRAPAAAKKKAKKMLTALAQSAKKKKDECSWIGLSLSWAVNL
jgi:hypothetical protein